MRKTLTIRLIEKASRARLHARPFMRLAGVVDDARDLSRRKGFSRSRRG
jgi:hypothetical protein